MKKTLKWRIAQFVELLWWKNYLKNKDKSQYLDWKKKYWLDILSQMKDELNLSELKTGLDVGCGPTGMFMALPDMEVVAVDPLMDEYETNLAHFSKKDYPTVQFYSLPFEAFNIENKFDVVFCMNAINHVSDLAACFDKLKQYTNENGYLVVSIDAHNHQLFKHLFRLLPGDILHPHQYDFAEYKQFLTDRNFSIIKAIHHKKEFFFDHYVIVAKKQNKD